ncbi:MAG: hypothetical protein U1F71_12580 [Verrucomicrobiaceae bacterium]
METLISIFTAVLEFLTAAKKCCEEVGASLNRAEVVGGLIFLVVAIAGLGAFGRRRKPGELPWD